MTRGLSPCQVGSHTKEIQKVWWARGCPSVMGMEAGRGSLPFRLVVFVFSI